MAKDPIIKKIGENDHVFKWERTRKTTFRGAKRDLSKALSEYLDDKIGDPLPRSVIIDFQADAVSVTEADTVVLHSATE